MAKYYEPLLINLPSHKKPSNILCERQNLHLPELTERDVMKHFLRLSQMNYGVDTGFYPLGSCTMKYNLKLLERVSRSDKTLYVNPLQSTSTTQGCLELQYRLEEMLSKITGMDAFSLQPCAGAHGELTGMLITRAYFENLCEERTEVIIPDSAHGTNPASAKMAGFDVVEITSKDGRVDLDALNQALSERTAAFMLTNPNTLGIFEKEILEIAKMVKDVGGLLYYDGANLNAIMGKTNPGVMGFDIVHVNLHKTFGTPHGGGGPGSGPVGVKKDLEKYLPVPRIIKSEEQYDLDYERPHSIGKISLFYGNFGVLLRAYAYILKMGNNLTELSERAVLNANYLMQRLHDIGYEIPFSGKRMHEFVLSLVPLLRERNLRAMDVAKRLLDYGFHPPTIYFPLIIEEAFMIEPTETEHKETLDSFAQTLQNILKEDPAKIKQAPLRMPVNRVNEVLATKEPRLTWKDL